MFIFYFVYTKHQVLLIFYENKEIYVANLIDTIEVDFLLGINIWGLRCFLKWYPALAFIHLKCFIYVIRHFIIRLEFADFQEFQVVQEGQQFTTGVQFFNFTFKNLST